MWRSLDLVCLQLENCSSKHATKPFLTGRCLRCLLILNPAWTHYQFLEFKVGSCHSKSLDLYKFLVATVMIIGTVIRDCSGSLQYVCLEIELPNTAIDQNTWVLYNKTVIFMKVCHPTTLMSQNYIHFVG